MGFVLGINRLLFVRHCGSRTAGEVLFWAVAKEYLARGARTAMPNEKEPVNAKHKTHKKEKLIMRECQNKAPNSMT